MEGGGHAASGTMIVGNLTHALLVSSFIFQVKVDFLQEMMVSVSKSRLAAPA